MSLATRIRSASRLEATRNHKTTYASLFGVAGAKARAIALIEAAKRETDAFSDNSFLVWLADMVLNRDH